MKKKAIIIGLVVMMLVAIGVVAGILIKKHMDEKTYTMDEFVTLDVSKIKAMSIMNGEDGNVVDVASEDYEEIIEMLKGVTMQGVYKDDNKKVYPLRYTLNITDDKGTKVVSFYTTKCSIGAKEYNLTGYDDAGFILRKIYNKAEGAK